MIITKIWGIRIEYEKEPSIKMGVSKVAYEAIIPANANYVYDCIDNFMSSLGEMSYMYQNPQDNDSFECLKKKVAVGIQNAMRGSVSQRFKTVYSEKTLRISIKEIND